MIGIIQERKRLVDGQDHDNPYGENVCSSIMIVYPRLPSRMTGATLTQVSTCTYD